MILDMITNAAQYAGVHKGIDLALKEMAAYTAQNYSTGKKELDGDNVFLLCNEYETKNPDGALTEAHQKYIDVMYMVEGEETIFVKPVTKLQNITQAYDPSIEALLAQTDEDATPVRLTAGSFVVLFPQDAHAPACWVDGPKTVKKIIGKVRV